MRTATATVSIAPSSGSCVGSPEKSGNFRSAETSKPLQLGNLGGFNSQRESLLAKTSLILLAITACGIVRFSRAAEGPKTIATGEWSAAVDDGRGYSLRGRLVLAEKHAGDNRGEVAVYIELQDASKSVGKSMLIFCDFGRVDFRPEYKGGLHCELRDKNKQLVKTLPTAFGGGVPQSRWIELPSDATIRLRTSPFGIGREKAMAIWPELTKLWEIKDGDPNDYFLSGTFTVAPSETDIGRDGGHIWRGTLTLPAVRIKNEPK